MRSIPNYRSNRDGPRWSRLAVVSLLTALSGPVVFFGAVSILKPTTAGTVSILLGLAALFLPPLAAFVLGITAIVLTACFHGQLRGQSVAWVGVLLALAWPAFVVGYVVLHPPHF